MKPLTALLAAIFLHASLGSMQAANAQGAMKPKTASSTAKKRPAYAQEPLETWTDELGPGYKGHACIPIAKRLHSLKVDKDAFETTAAHADRMGALGKEKIVGSTLIGDTFGFVDAYRSFSEDYDADRGTLHVRGIWGAKMQRIGDAFFVAELLDSTQLSTRSYTAANAYGRTAQVTSTTARGCGLLFTNIPLKLLQPNIRQLDVSLELSPEQARLAIYNIQIMFVGKLAPPYLSGYFDFTRPTIKDPREKNWEGDNLTIELQQVWLFNRKTGHVYKKIDI